MIEKKKLQILTEGENDIIDITGDVEKFLNNSKITDGVVSIFVSGSTAGLTTMEYEDGLIKDLKIFFEEIVPHTKKYFHDYSFPRGNGFSHIRASVLGPSLVIPFESKRLSLGTWQQIVLIDFDIRKRERTIHLDIIGG